MDWRLQANEEGGLSRAALKKAEELAIGAETRVTAPRKHSTEGVKLVLPEPDSFVDWDPRLPPPGNIVERQYKGKMIRVIVLQEGFEYEGRRYKSLTARNHNCWLYWFRRSSSIKAIARSRLHSTPAALKRWNNNYRRFNGHRKTQTERQHRLTRPHRDPPS